MKNILTVCMLLLYSANGAANAVEKFTADADMVAVAVNGKPFKVHEQNYIPEWNVSDRGNPPQLMELKNLMITGTLTAGLTVNTVEVTTVHAGAKVAYFSDRSCTQPTTITGATVKAGEQVYYLKVLTPDGSAYQVYTLSIMGLSAANHAQYFKYGEPTYVADSYLTWFWALQNAKPGQRIAVTKIEHNFSGPGQFKIKPMIENKQDLVVRSLSGSPEDLILRGHGIHKGSYRGDRVPSDVLFTVAGTKTKNIVVYGITAMESSVHGFKLDGWGEENITFDNCRTIDVCERHFKGSGPQIDGKFTRSKNITIINCSFENTQVPIPSDHSPEFNGDYIGGIDVMNLSGLTIAGCTFKNIVGHNGAGRGAIFIWGQDGCENVVIENNIIINCDRGMALGNPSGDPAGSTTGYYINHGIVRNNYVCNSNNELIEINRLNDVKFYNNTLWKANASGRGFRDSGGAKQLSHNISLVNNIICGAVNELPHGNNLDVRHNLFSFSESSGVLPKGEGNASFSIPETFFMRAAFGDFRLRATSSQAFKKGIPLPESATDFFGTPRSSTPDLGAHQHSRGN